MASTRTRAAARAYAAEHGVKYTAALRAVTVTRAAGSYPEIVVGQRIRFHGDRIHMTVRAVSESGRFIVLTFLQFGEIRYTVMDFDLGIRGPGNALGQGMNCETDEDCQNVAYSFELGAMDHDAQRAIQDASEVYIFPAEVSFRNWVWLRYTDDQGDPRTAELLPRLREITKNAPPRSYNDHEPRLQVESQQ